MKSLCWWRWRVWREWGDHRKRVFSSNNDSSSTIIDSRIHVVAATSAATYCMMLPPPAVPAMTSRRWKFLTHVSICSELSLLPSAGRETSMLHLRAIRGEDLVWLIGAVVRLLAAPRVQLFVTHYSSHQHAYTGRRAVFNHQSDYCARQHICYCAHNAIAIPSVCLSVCLSHGWFMQKRAEVSIMRFSPTVALSH